MADASSHEAGSGPHPAPTPEPPSASPDVTAAEAEQAREQQSDSSRALPPLPPRPVSEDSSTPPSSLQQPHPQTRRQQQQRQYYQAQPLPAARYQTHPEARTYQHIDQPIPFSAKWHRAKQILSAASMLCSTVILAVAIVLAAGPGAMTGYNYITDYSLVIFTPALILGALAILWQACEAITLCTRKDKLGIHPGAHVGVQLIIWMIAVITLGILAAATAYTMDSQHELNQALADGDLSDSDLNSSRYGYQYGCYNVTLGTCLTYLNGTMPLNIVLTLFSGLLFVIHFTLFVRACVETHQRNQAKRTIILVPASAIPGASGMNGSLGQQQMIQSGYYAPAPINGAYGVSNYRDSRSILSQQQQRQTLLPPQRAPGNNATDPAAQPMSQLYGFYAPEGGARMSTAYQAQQQQQPAQSRAGPSVVQSNSRRSKGKGKEVAPPSQLNTVDESISRDDVSLESDREPAVAGPSNSGDGVVGTAR